MFAPLSPGRRPRRLFALAVAGAIAVGLLSALSGSPRAAEAEPCWDGPDQFDCPEITGTGPIIVIPAGPADERDTFLRRRFESGLIGPDATGIQVKTQEVPLTDVVTCGMETYESGNPWWRWEVTATEWAAGIFLPFGDQRPSGGSYDLTCSSTLPPPGTIYDGAVGSGWTVVWSLYPTADPTGEIYVASTEITSDDWQYTDTSGLEIDDLQIATGDRIQIIGAPGTFGYSQWGADSALRVGDYGDPIEYSILEQVVGAPDGHMIYGQVGDASYYSAPFFSGPVWIDLTSVNTTWRGTTTMIDGDHPTAVKVAVSSSTATSRKPVKATVVLTVPHIPNPEGRVDVLVDGKKVATTMLRAGSAGRSTITMPTIGRGVHKVTAVFRGSENLAPSTSPGAYLRILF
jgi:hypothetical protein